MTLSRASFLRVALPGATALAAFQPAFARAATDPGAFSGTYKYAGGKTQREKLEHQIEQVVAQLNFMIRNMARSRLTDGLSPAPVLGFDFGTNRVVFRKPGQPTIEGPIDGSPVDWKNDHNERVRLRLKLQGETLSINYKGDGSDSTYQYRFVDGGKRIDIRARIDHVRMPSTLRYGLTYKRA